MALSTPTRLESLSNELLLDIFEYFDAYTLCSIFYGMNWRLSNVLRLCPLHIQFDKHKRNKKIWNTLATFINPAKICTLSLYRVAIDKRFLPSISENLVSLYFYGMNRHSIDRILRYVPTINRIKTLGIYQKVSRRSDSFFCDYVFFEHGYRLSSLINLSLRGYSNYNEFPIIDVIFLKLRRLSLTNFILTPNFAQFLEKNTPNLRSLYFHRTNTFFKPVSSVIKHIQELDINVRPFAVDLENILSKLPGLKRLRILWDNTRSSFFFDGIQWQKIIEKYLPYLQHFTLDFVRGISETIANTFYDGDFWSTRKVVMKLVRNKISFQRGPVTQIYFERKWHFKYFNCVKITLTNSHRNWNLPLQSSSLSHVRSRSRSSSLITISSRAPSRSQSPLKLRSESRSRSRSRSRLRPRSRTQRQRHSRLRQSLRLQSPSESQPRRRSRSRSRSCLRPRSRSQRRTRRQQHSRLRRNLQLHGRSRSPRRSQSRLCSRRRLQSPSESRSRRRSRSRSRIGLRSRAHLRS